MSARPLGHPLDPATTPVTITEHQLLQQLEPGSNTAKLLTGPKHILCFFTSGYKISSMTLAKDVTFDFIFRQLSSSLKRAIDLGALPTSNVSQFTVSLCLSIPANAAKQHGNQTSKLMSESIKTHLDPSIFFSPDYLFDFGRVLLGIISGVHKNLTSLPSMCSSISDHLTILIKLVHIYIHNWPERYI